VTSFSHSAHKMRPYADMSVQTRGLAWSPQPDPFSKQHILRMGEDVPLVPDKISDLPLPSRMLWAEQCSVQNACFHLIAGAINTVQQSTNKSSTSTATVPDIDGSHEDSLGVLVRLVITLPIMVWFW